MKPLERGFIYCVDWGYCTENHLNCVANTSFLVAFIRVHHFLRAASSLACPYAGNIRQKKKVKRGADRKPEYFRLSVL